MSVECYKLVTGDILANKWYATHKGKMKVDKILQFGRTFAHINIMGSKRNTGLYTTNISYV